jgi:hypothetical protein
MTTKPLKGLGGELPQGGLETTFNLSTANTPLGVETQDTGGAVYVLMRGCTGLTQYAAVLFDSEYNTTLAVSGAATNTQSRGLAVYVGSNLNPADSTTKAGYFLIRGATPIQSFGVGSFGNVFLGSTPGALEGTGLEVDFVSNLVCTLGSSGGIGHFFAYNVALTGDTGGGAPITFDGVALVPTSVNADTTITSTIGTRSYYVDASSGPVVITIPNPVGDLGRYEITKTDNSANTVTIAGNITLGGVVGNIIINFQDSCVTLGSDGITFRLN